MLLTLLLLMAISITPSSTLSSTSSSALVLYDSSTAPLARFRETSKRLTVSPGTTVTLEQDWAGFGVAGVLWDSVSLQ